MSLFLTPSVSVTLSLPPSKERPVVIFTTTTLLWSYILQATAKSKSAWFGSQRVLTVGTAKARTAPKGKLNPVQEQIGVVAQRSPILEGIGVEQEGID